MRSWLVLFACLVLGGTVHGESRVVVAAADRTLVAALRDALAPVGMSVVDVTDVPPAAIGELAAMSRRVAAREGATAVVWLLVERDGATLVAYDRDVDRVLVRPLPYQPPLSPARAAETARAARTMLRALKLTDDEEQRPPPEAAAGPTLALPPETITYPVPARMRPYRQAALHVGLGGRFGR
ncbi:MAG TPA: hypothetical protein VK427_26050, partial [Kofleriaceae bacterium]|nr:hypothetical protein [Kofleriaceae bacterium]